jgi:cytosine/adenosine deaminase-related metal-dependent hydrolase
MARLADRPDRARYKVMPAPPPPARALTFINARMGVGATTLRILGSRIVALGAAAEPGDRVVDLRGDRLLPGLINAHDHLQLNSLPRLEFASHYRNVRQWIDDINTRRRSDPAFEASIAISRNERLAVGGVKNLLSGVTTVAHHDPFYSFLSSPLYPTKVVADYDWSHSLYIDGEDQVRSAYRNTPGEWPWIIHAAEGLDEEAANEFERLDALGCLGSNTLIVHGVALDDKQRARLDRAAAGLIWCPSSNLRLFGRTAEVDYLIARGRVALGSDSRLSGARDLLDELRVAGKVGGLEDSVLESLVTANSARLLRLADRGVLQAGARADILILPAGMRLSEATRADVRLVLTDGGVRYGDRDYAQKIAPASHWVEVRVDGAAKILDRGIAGLLSNASAKEDGLELPTPIRQGSMTAVQYHSGIDNRFAGRNFPAPRQQ